MIPENQLEFGYKDCSLCFVEKKGDESRCSGCSGRYSAREKLLWKINRKRIKRISRLLSLIFPGLGHLYAGRLSTGLFWIALIPLTMGLVINTFQGLTVGHLVLAAMFALLWLFAFIDAGRGYKDKTAPCESACPSHLHVPDYIALVREGSPVTSLALIHETLPFASVCGRVCPHPCEQECVRNEVGSPIAIAAIKRFAADHGYRSRPIPREAEIDPNMPKVAIIGAGPAGLSAANTLATLGARTVIFDAKWRPGGMMYSCIPSFRLPLEELDRDIDFILKKGVDFRGGVTVGQDMEFESLVTGGEFDAILVATGSSESLTLPGTGTESQGFYDAPAFLERVKFGEMVHVGQIVVVVGGGNVAVDAARTALRLGVRDVTIASLESRDSMPAFPWEVEEAIGEGAKLMDGTAVKKFFVMRQRIAGFEALSVSRLEYDRQGRINPVTVPGSEFEVRCDTVIIAIGSRADLSFIPAEYALKMIDKEHKIARLIFKDKRYKIPIYTCGDCLTGASTIVESSASGRYAALNIFEKLCVEEVRKVRLRDNYRRKKEDQVEDSPELRQRVKMEKLGPADAASGFEEIEKGYTGSEVQRECDRCARCNLTL
ncbi:MAG: FAD-dependent oxidoreductase [Deltaproteobacteria bacterium]|nr:FAD-dependent oxidoreductase [Deltaproteobacteria bacterium]NIS78010.1 FAD-dependent oxidoreductase [Deltaproteobacteria bacterium]